MELQPLDRELAQVHGVLEQVERGSGEPGMIVSRVVAGSRGSVAGVKPYAIVVAVNDQPVRTAAEFSEGVKAGGALTLAVRRMHQSRVVNITPTP